MSQLAASEATTAILPPSYWYMGGLLKMLATGADTNGQLTTLETVMRRGLEPPRHFHQHEDESVYLLEGELEFTVGEETTHLRAGDYLFLPRQVPHHFRILTDTCRYLVQLLPAGLEQMFLELAVPAPVAELPPRPTGPPPPEVLARIGALQARFGIEMQQAKIFGH